LTKGYVRIEIFEDVHFMDDDLSKDWNLQFVGTQYSSDGDVLTLTNASANQSGVYKIIDSFSSDEYPKIVVRVTETNENGWSLALWDGSSWDYIWEEIKSTGLYIDTLPSGKTYSRILLVANSAGGIPTTKFDYVVICKDFLNPITNNKVKRLEINDCLLNKGVSNAIFTILDDDDYSDDLTFGSRVLIWISQTQTGLGHVTNKVFGGIVNAKTRIKHTGDIKKCEIECHGLGFQLQTPPSLVKKEYNNVNGKDIIIDVLNKSGVKISDLKVDPDNEIATSFNKTYDDKIPYEIINEICKESKKSDGSQGFDGWVSPSGVLWVFPQGKYENIVAYAITEDKIIEIEKIVDAYRVKNKIKVYGAHQKYLPEDQDEWTESTQGWTVDAGSLTTTSNNVKVGSVSLKMNGGDNGAKIHRTFDAIEGNINIKTSYDYLNAWIYKSTANTLKIRLYAPDSSNYFEYTAPAKAEIWHQIQVPLGPDYVGTYPNGSPKPWQETGNPNWENIQGIEIWFDAPDVNIYALIDGLHFGPASFSAQAEDTNSQNLYGVRSKELVEDDTLFDDDACQLKAESLLNYLKEPSSSLVCRIKGQSLRLRPGWYHPVLLPSLGISEYTYFKIIDYTHEVNENDEWHITVKLNREPIYIDKIFRKLFELSS